MYVNISLSTAVKKKFIPLPHVKPAKDATIPNKGFLLPYVNSNAVNGIITTYPISPIILNITLKNTRANVMVFFLKYFVRIVKVVLINPLFSIIPIPISTIISILNGVKAVKLETVELNIYFTPLKLNKDSTLSDVVTYSPVDTSILLYVASNPIRFRKPLSNIVANINIIKVITGFKDIFSLNLFILFTNNFLKFFFEF